MKKLYATSWILLAALAFVSVVTGTVNGLTFLAISLVALGLVHGLAFWSVFTNTRELQSE